MKKILSMMLALCMIATMLTVTVNAAGDPGDAAVNKQLWVSWDADYLNVGTSFEKGDSLTYLYKPNKLQSVSGLSMLHTGVGGLGFVGNSLKGSTADVLLKDAENETDKAFKLNTDLLQSTWRAYYNGGNLIEGENWTNNTMDENNNNAITFSAQFMIPTDQAGATADPTTVTRTLTFPIEVRKWEVGDSAYNGDELLVEDETISNLVFEMVNENGGIKITPSVSNASVVGGLQKSIYVDLDDWFELDAETFVGKEGESLIFCLSVDGELCGYYKSDYNYSRDVTQYNDEDETTKDYLNVLATGNIMFSSGDTGKNTTDKTIITWIDAWEVYTSAKEVPSIPNTLKITGDATSGLTISGQSDASTYTSADLVVAFYNGNKLIAPIKKISLTNDVAGQNFVVDEDVDVTEIPEGATKVKAFLFDSLTTAKPLMSNAILDDLGEQ